MKNLRVGGMVDLPPCLGGVALRNSCAYCTFESYTLSMIELEIPGTPLSWRAPFVGSRGAFSIRTPILRQLKAILRHSYKEPKVSSALCLDAIFILPIPKSYSKKKRTAMLSGEILPTVHKDRSNMLKFVEDVLQGIVFEDDCQIIDGRCCKRYGENPHTLIRIYDPKEYWDKFGGLC